MSAKRVTVSSLYGIPCTVEKVEIDEDPRFGEVCDRARIVFEVLAESPDGNLIRTNETLCIFQEFNDQNDAIEGQLQHLGINYYHELERLNSDLRGRRIWGLIGKPRKEKGFQPINDLKPWDQRPSNVEIRSLSDFLSGLGLGRMVTPAQPTNGLIALEPPIGPKADQSASLNLTLEPLEAHEKRHPHVAKLIIDRGNGISSTKPLGEGGFLLLIPVRYFGRTYTYR